MEAKSPRGTSDILPSEVGLWRRVEEAVAEVMRAYDYREIRTPVFEHTELFQRGVGETTDIVEKQMYTFVDRGGRSVTLRPEGTAPVVRAFLEHKLAGHGLPQRLWYIQPMFRYERPQAGRSRQFHQFGAEAIGSSDPACDVEMIAIPIEVYRRLGITRYEVLLNSIGCPACRPAYREALRAFLSGRLDALCGTCRSRYDRNPMRILDCKVEGCKQATAGAPSSIEHLCGECREHFEAVQRLLRTLEIPFSIDTRLVRGLDYYTKTVFEVVTDALGAQGALAAGGRYDGLTEELGGPPTPAVGFGAGMERAVLMLKEIAAASDGAGAVDVFVASLGASARPEAIRIADRLRKKGVATRIDYRDRLGEERSLKAQLKAAGKSGAGFVVILGEDELARGVATLKDMVGGGQEEIPLAEIDEAVALRIARLPEAAGAPLGAGAEAHSQGR